MGSSESSESPPGTLDLLILKALARQPMHGYGIAQHLRIRLGRRPAGGRELALPCAAALASEGLGHRGVGRVREQSPGPLLHAHPSGRRQAAAERREFDRMVLAINRVLDFT
jgi:hypothetical protein